MYLPPAAEGDVYRATLKHPKAIGIIDGYFQSIATVRHKEILWAMSRGIHVFGSASIGALRAVELAAFGMEGVGTVFELYRDGVLEDDDEVAVAHGLAEVGFLAGSEAMVNIRQTLLKAELAGVISRELEAAIVTIAKELFYPDRNYPLLLRSAFERGLPKAELDRLQQWLPEGRVNQKREDAVAMLRLIHRRLEEGLEPKTVSYSFQHTAMWEAAWRQSGELRFDAHAQPSVTALDSVLDELRLQGDQYKQHNLLGAERFLAIREAYRLGLVVTKERRRQTELLFRRERDLLDGSRFERWVADNGLTDEEFEALMMDEARVRWVRQLAQFVSVSSLPDQLRLSGDYPRLFARAAAKNRLLESFGLKNPCLQDVDLTESQLLGWYFTKLLGRSIPSDLRKYFERVGFDSPDAFRRAILREYLYRRLERQPSTPADRPQRTF